MIIITFAILLYWLLERYLPYISMEGLGNPEKIDFYKQLDSDTLAVIVAAYSLAFLLGLMFRAVGARVESVVRSKKADSDTLAVLSIAQKKHGYVTAADIASRSSISLDRSQGILDMLQKQGYADLSVAKTGDILYYFPVFEDVVLDKEE